MGVVRFPQERATPRHDAEMAPPLEPCLILILPVVRIDRDDAAPLLGPRQTRRCRNSINRIRLLKKLAGMDGDDK